MPQQINLCTPILLPQHRYFSARTMAQSLLIVLLVGGGLCAYWVWSLSSASAGLTKILGTQAREVESLQAAIFQGKAVAAPTSAKQGQDLQNKKAELAQRERLLRELQRGLFRPGAGHSARLQLLAQTTPPLAWITSVRTDDAQLEVGGFTLEPSVLSAWVEKLALSPLLDGQTLATVKVEKVNAAATKAATGGVLPSAATPSSPPSRWAFHLVSATPSVPASAALAPKPQTTGSAMAGGKS